MNSGNLVPIRIRVHPCSSAANEKGIICNAK